MGVFKLGDTITEWHSAISESWGLKFNIDLGTDYVVGTDYWYLWTGVVAFLVLEFTMMIDNNKYNVVTMVKLHGVLMVSYMAYGFVAMFMGQIKWGHNV